MRLNCSDNKMKNLLLSMASVCVLAGAPSLAYGNQPVPTFSASGGWTVGATDLVNVRGLNGAKMPCVVSTEFDNGFIMRLSGGGQKILAMAIDFRQDVFAKGKKYNTMVTLGDSYVKQTMATAFTPSTLIFNLRDLPDFYAQTAQQKLLELSIDSNVFKFSLGDLGKSLTTLEGCYNGKKTNPLPSIAAAKQGGNISSAPPLPSDFQNKSMPRNFDDIVQGSSTKNTGMTAFPGDSAPLNIAPDRNIAARKSANVAGGASGQWTAYAGENVRTALSRWANDAGYDLDWQAQGDNILPQDVSFNGSFEQAVNQLLAETEAAKGMTASLKDASAPSSAIGAWNAVKGADLKSVINAWSSREGVKVVWGTFGNMPLKSDFSSQGSFESALQSLLDQHQNDSLRPFAELNRDPSTGAKTLTMTTEK